MDEIHPATFFLWIIEGRLPPHRNQRVNGHLRQGKQRSRIEFESRNVFSRIRAIRFIPWFLANDLVLIEHEQQILNAKKHFIWILWMSRSRFLVFMKKYLGNKQIRWIYIQLGIFFGRLETGENSTPSHPLDRLASFLPNHFENCRRDHKRPRRLSSEGVGTSPGRVGFFVQRRTVLKVQWRLFGLCKYNEYVWRTILQQIRGYIITVNKWINMN